MREREREERESYKRVAAPPKMCKVFLANKIIKKRQKNHETYNCFYQEFFVCLLNLQCNVRAISLSQVL